MGGPSDYAGVAHVDCNIKESIDRKVRKNAVKRSIATGWTGWMGPGGEIWSRPWLETGKRVSDD